MKRLTATEVLCVLMAWAGVMLVTAALLGGFQ